MRPTLFRITHRKVLSVALPAALLLQAPLHAQQKAPVDAATTAVQTPAISGFDARAFRDSLARLTERRTLRDMEQHSAQTKTAQGLIEAGFIALRSWELSRLQDDAKKSQQHFEAARLLDANDPWPLYGWALAVLTQMRPDGDTGKFGFAGDDHLMEDLGLDPRSRARRVLEKAVAIDPAMPEAVHLLSSLAVETRDKSAITQVDAALQKMVDARPDDPATRLALANAAFAKGDFETAAAAAKAAASLSTSDASAAHHLAARALLRMPGRENDGAEEYFAGLRNLTPDESRKYYDEIRGIATHREMTELHTLPLVRAQSWIRTFWEMHAALSAVTVSHRLASHYRRLPQAEQFYRRRQRYGAPTSNALLLERPESPFDDRGFVYLKHGRPDDVINTRNTQSWVYLNEGGKPLMFHFTDGQTEGITGFGDWYLMYNVPCDADFIAARAIYDKRMSPLMFRCDPLNQRDISARIRRDVNSGLNEDVDDIGFLQPLSATYDIYTFRGEHAWTDIVGSLAVQAARLKPLPLADGDRIYSVNASLIVIDTATRLVSRRDTVIQAQATNAASRGSIVLGDLQLTAAPGNANVHRVSVADGYVPTRGQLYGGPLKVPDYSGDTLMISDVVLAAPDTGGTFKRGDVSLTLVPWQAFPGGAFRVFYEIYNLSPGNPYRTELKMESASKGFIGGIIGKKPAIALTFEDVASPGGRVVQQVRDAKADLSPGDYRFTVTVTDLRTGQKISRTRPVTVTK